MIKSKGFYCKLQKLDPPAALFGKGYLQFREHYFKGDPREPGPCTYVYE